MRNFAMFNYDFLFGDHFKNVSKEARLYYVELSFYAVNGFVANSKSIIQEKGYKETVLQELIDNGDILTLPNRSEVFVTAFFIHNRGVAPKVWMRTAYYPYWKNKLFIKYNGVATFNPQGEEPTEPDTNDPLEGLVDDSLINPF